MSFNFGNNTGCIVVEPSKVSCTNSFYLNEPSSLILIDPLEYVVELTSEFVFPASKNLIERVLAKISLECFLTLWTLGQACKQTIYDH